MKRYYVLIALIIGASVVFVAQNGFNRNYSEPIGTDGLPPISSPTSPQTNLPPDQLSPTLPKNQQIAQPDELPEQPIKQTSISDLRPEEKPKQDESNDITTKKPVNNQSPSDESESESIADDTVDYDLEKKNNNEPEANEQKDHEKAHTNKEHHEHHDKSTTTNLNNDNVNFILLVSYFRSGSSFVGDLLQQPDGTFYTFEPFKYFDFNHKVDFDHEEDALRIIQNIFQCTINEEENYSDWMCDGEKAGSSISRNHFLWESCESSDTICCDPDYVDQVCSQTRTRVIKETRITLESVEKLLQRLPNWINLKVVFLARDPRGIYNSRKHYSWCKETPCIDYEQLCEDLTSDLKIYPRLVETYGNRVMIARFEDIALEPFVKGEILYESLGLPYTSETINFIDTHITENNTEPGDSFAVLHNSRELITKWVTQLNETIVDEIQKSCEFVFEQLGYKPVVLSEMTEATDDDLNEIYSAFYSLPNHL